MPAPAETCAAPPGARPTLSLLVSALPASLPRAAFTRDRQLSPPLVGEIADAHDRRFGIAATSARDRVAVACEDREALQKHPSVGGASSVSQPLSSFAARMCRTKTPAPKVTVKPPSGAHKPCAGFMSALTRVLRPVRCTFSSSTATSRVARPQEPLVEREGQGD
jgi:hypothetical protein